jgi:hypothetical protein
VPHLPEQRFPSLQGTGKGSHHGCRMTQPNPSPKGNTMSTSVWDDPDLRVGGDYAKFENVGDSVSGTVNAVRAHRFDDGSVAPQILLTTDGGEEKTVTCGAIRLKVAVAEQRPEPGDHITITYTQEEKRAGGRTLKHWDVKVTRGGARPTPPAAAAPQAAPAATEAPVDQASLAAALGNLTDEQKKALGLA